MTRPWRTQRAGAHWSSSMPHAPRPRPLRDWRTRWSLGRALCGLLLALGVQLASLSVALAADTGDLFSEIITPKGWERRPCEMEACGWIGDVATSYEIVVPRGWSDSRASEASWGGRVCSELVVPEAWHRKGVR